MIYELRLPLIGPHMAEARIECIHATSGSALKTGAKLIDLSIDLSSSFSQDCPPISFFRIIVRENVVLNEICLTSGQTCKVGELIARFSTTADEDTNQPPQRGIRIATAGVMHHGGMWTGNDH
jgi:pyruvate/2-oxoglutarate dehydrogenase complex dihydrolipoamide acyltransferase (E2) component